MDRIIKLEDGSMFDLEDISVIYMPISRDSKSILILKNGVKLPIVKGEAEVLVDARMEYHESKNLGLTFEK